MVDEAIELRVERVGGLAGFGGSSRLRSEGRLTIAELEPADRERLRSLLTGPPPTETAMRDGFRFRITWREKGRERVVELPEAAVPEAVRARVTDGFR